MLKTRALTEGDKTIYIELLKSINIRSDVYVVVIQKKLWGGSSGGR